MAKQKSRKLQVALRMPPLYHTVPGREFDILDSQVVRWLVKQPGIAQYVFDKAREYLRFDQETRKWEGRDYDN